MKLSLRSKTSFWLRTVVGHLVRTASDGVHVELLGVRLDNRLGDDLTTLRRSATREKAY